MKADGDRSETAQAETAETPQDSKTSSKARSKATKNSKQDEKARNRERTSDKSKKGDKGRSKGKKRDMDDLRSKLPPDLQGKIFDMSDMQDMDMDSLKAKLEAMKLEKQGEPCLCCASSLILLQSYARMLLVLFMLFRLQQLRSFTLQQGQLILESMMSYDPGWRS